jgi:hypothetical protein
MKPHPVIEAAISGGFLRAVEALDGDCRTITAYVPRAGARQWFGGEPTTRCPRCGVDVLTPKIDRPARCLDKACFFKQVGKS